MRRPGGRSPLSCENMKITLSQYPTRQVNIGHVLGVALLLRIFLPLAGYFYTPDVTIFHDPDTDTYIAPARELIANQRFFSYGTPEIARTPGYPLSLTPGLLFHRLEATTIILQIALSCFTVYMVYLIAQLLFKREQVSVTAATLYAIEPLSIFYSSQILTETLFTTLGTVWLYFLLRYLKNGLLRHLLISGVILAASVYVRPIGYFLPILIAAGLGIYAFANGQHDTLRLVTHSAIFLVMTMGLIIPWQLRNRAETGYSGFSSLAPLNMYFYLANSVLAAQQHVPFFEMRHRLGYNDVRQDQVGYLNEDTYLARHPEQKSWAIAQRLSYIDHEAVHILLMNPWTYARMHVLGIVHTIVDPGATNFLIFFRLYRLGGGFFGGLQDRGMVKTVSEAIVKNPLIFWSNALLLPMELAYLSFACIALFSRRVRLDPAVLTAFLILSYYIAIPGASQAQARFREPAMPMISVLAGYGLWLGSQRWRGTRESIILTHMARSRRNWFLVRIPSGPRCPERQQVSLSERL